MLVLLDNDVPYGLRRLIRPHVCFHAKQLDWAGLQNGYLLKAAEGRKFEVMITADQSMFYQQNDKKRNDRTCCIVHAKLEAHPGCLPTDTGSRRSIDAEQLPIHRDLAQE